MHIVQFKSPWVLFNFITLCYSLLQFFLNKSWYENTTSIPSTRKFRNKISITFSSITMLVIRFLLKPMVLALFKILLKHTFQCYWAIWQWYHHHWTRYWYSQKNWHPPHLSILCDRLASQGIIRAKHLIVHIGCDLNLISK